MGNECHELSAIWTYTWTVSSTVSTEVSVTVSGTDLAGIAYSGTENIVFTIVQADTVAPTVILNDSDMDNLVNVGDTVVVTATFDEPMTASPRISISGQVNSLAMSGSISPKTIYAINNPTNIYKRSDGTYLLRTTTDVYSSTSLSGPYTSLGFTQSNSNPAGNLLGETQDGKVMVSTESNGLYKYDNGTWVQSGLSGGGTGGNNFYKLSNGRIIVGKKGFLRKMYYSDDNGANWTAASGNIAEDWYHLIELNGNLFVSSAGTQNKGGIITSTDNGSSWTKLRDQKTYSMEVYEGAIYIVSEDGNRNSGVYKVFKSTDDGQSWEVLTTLPNNNGIGVLMVYHDMIVFKSNSDGDYYYKSINDLSASWKLFGTNETLGSHSIENKVIDGIPLIFTSSGASLLILLLYGHILGM